MKKFLLLGFVGFTIQNFSVAQQPFIGLQNGPRKGMISAQMNPAELTNLTKEVEVNLFSAHTGLSNNALSFQDVLNADDILNLALERANKPFNLRTDIAFLGPSAGFKTGKWAFGVGTQAYLKADVVDLDVTLGRALLGDFDAASSTISTAENRIALNYPNNQRFTVAGWSELDLMAAREIIRVGHQKLGAGINVRFIFPSVYANMGLSGLWGTLVEDDFSIRLTDTFGELNVAYSHPFDTDEFGFEESMFRLGGLGGVALDFGANYTLERDNGKTLLNAGLSFKNIGGMSFRGNQSNTTYSVNIPEGEYFRVDDLNGSFEEIEEELLNTGYFEKIRDPNRTRVNFPTMINAYAEFSPTNLFHVSLFLQQRLSDETSNILITHQNMVVVTPRIVLGKFQIYSPWSHFQVAGINGGLGLQFGGFFVGSHSIVTGLIADTRQADIHLGLSWGFGNSN
ncbi:hypothetical protein [Pleomorphovibrio marinus]|uniref:hypothetical protein n=1 Tax=Pleomorphovibrio marinus TaxID=2164132 RepID=UPI000E0B355B|nr:hypothetical protein [Pleomorphovibrio marinus]